MVHSIYYYLVAHYADITALSHGNASCVELQSEFLFRASESMRPVPMLLIASYQSLRCQ